MFSFKNSLGFWRKQETRSKDKKEKEKGKEKEKEVPAPAESPFAPQPSVAEPSRPFRTIPTPVKEEPQPTPIAVTQEPVVPAPAARTEPTQAFRGRGRGRGHGASGAPPSREVVPPEVVGTVQRGVAPPRGRGVPPRGRGARPLPSVPPGGPQRGRAQKPARGVPIAARGAPQRRLPMPPGSNVSSATAAPGNQEYLARLAPKSGPPTHTNGISGATKHQVSGSAFSGNTESAVPARSNGRTDTRRDLPSPAPQASQALPVVSSQVEEKAFYGEDPYGGAIYDNTDVPQPTASVTAAPVSVSHDLPNAMNAAQQAPKKNPPAPPTRNNPSPRQPTAPVAPQAPPRSPRRSPSTPSGSAPPLPWREEEERPPLPQAAIPVHAPIDTPTPVLPTAVPVVQPTLPTVQPNPTPTPQAEASEDSPPESKKGSKSSKRKKKERPKKAKKTKGSRRLSSMFRRNTMDKIDTKKIEDVFIPETDVDVGDLPVYGLNIDHIHLSPGEQVSYLSSQVNELSDIITSLLSQRRRDGAVPQETARVDKLLSHYNDQFEIVSAELQNASRKQHSEYQPLENSPAREVTGSSSPHLARKHTYTQLKGLRQEQVRAVASCQTDHKLKLSYMHGDVILVIEKFPTGWWKGEIDGKTAYFQEKNTISISGDDTDRSSAEDVVPPVTLTNQSPTDHQVDAASVENGQEDSVLSTGEISQEEQWDAIESATEVGLPEESGYPTSEDSSQPAQVKQQEALALYGFEKSNDTEVGMTKGEVVAVVQVMDSWTYVHSSHGSGYVPTSYIKML